MKWFRKAAEGGYSEAQFNLGVLYEDGLGIPRDLVQALKWFSLATWLTRDPSKNQIYSQAMKEVGQKLPPDKVAMATQLAQEWMAKHQK